MRIPGDVNVDAKLKALVRQLMASFRQAVQSSGRAWLISMPPLKRFKVSSTSWLCRVSSQACERYELRPICGSAPAIEGWPTTQSGARVAHD